MPLKVQIPRVRKKKKEQESLETGRVGVWVDIQVKTRDRAAALGAAGGRGAASVNCFHHIGVCVTSKSTWSHHTQFTCLIIQVAVRATVAIVLPPG